MSIAPAYDISWHAGTIQQLGTTLHHFVSVKAVGIVSWQPILCESFVNLLTFQYRYSWCKSCKIESKNRIGQPFSSLDRVGKPWLHLIGCESLVVQVHSPVDQAKCHNSRVKRMDRCKAVRSSDCACIVENKPNRNLAGFLHHFSCWRHRLESGGVGFEGTVLLQCCVLTRYLQGAVYTEQEYKIASPWPEAWIKVTFCSPA